MSPYNGFVGPSFRQRLLGYASAGTVITVLVNGLHYAGRVLAVDKDNFEMVLTRNANGLVTGSIVNFSFTELGSIGVDAC